MYIDKIDPNNPKIVISDHYPEKYGDILIWNTESRKTEIDALAWNIAQQLRQRNREGAAPDEGVNTILLQEVPHSITSPEAPHAVMSVPSRLIERINYFLGAHKITKNGVEVDVPDSRLHIGNQNMSFQSKVDHNFGNLILSIHPVKDSTNGNEEEKAILEQLKTAIKQAGGEEGQVQVAIVNNKIVLNVHANPAKEGRTDTNKPLTNRFGDKIKQRINLHKLYAFIQENKSLFGREIIMAGDFNSGEYELPREILNEPNTFSHNLRRNAGYQHAIPGTSFITRADGNQTSNAVDAVFHFNIDPKNKPSLTPLVEANLAKNLPPEIKQVYPELLPPKPKLKPREKKLSEQEDQAKKTAFTSDDKATYLTSQLKKYCEEKKYPFEINGAKSTIKLQDGNKVEVTKHASGVEITTDLGTDKTKQENLIASMADIVKASGVKKVRIEVENVSDDEKIKIMDQMWLNAVNQGLVVDSYTPKNPDVIKKAPDAIKNNLLPKDEMKKEKLKDEPPANSASIKSVR